MINLQIAEKPVKNDDGFLDVVDVWRTIQGEGPYAGYPAIFVRLAGCNLQCPACDSDYTSNRKMREPVELFQSIRGMSQEAQISVRLVVFTGGEPFRQDISTVAKMLLMSDYHVQVETNGAFPPPIELRADPMFSIVVSPKTPTINKELVNHIPLAFKYVLRAGEAEADGLPNIALGGVRPARPPKWVKPEAIYLQPLDEGDEAANKANEKAVVESCMAHGYRLCLQLHKIVGLA